MKTKTVMKKSLALLLTVMMVLSSVVTSAFVFTAAAEEPAGGDEAELIASDGTTQLAIGSFLDVVAEANKATAPAGTTIRLLKDFELTNRVTIPAKVTLVDGTKADGSNTTVYMAADIAQTGTVAYFIRNDGSVTFRHVNLNGQPMNHTGDPVSFGSAANTQSGAFSYKTFSTKLELDGCRMEGFYSNVNGTCFYSENSLTAAESGYGIYLNDTVITGNRSLGATAGNRGCVFRARTGGSCGTEIYLSGSTVVDGNFDKDGKPGNILTAEQGSPTSWNQHTCVFVSADFTGLAGVSSYWAAKYDETTNELTKRGCVKFAEGYANDGTGMIYCNDGVITPTSETDRYGTKTQAKLIYRAAYKADGTPNNVWTVSSSMTDAIKAMTQTTTQPHDENGAVIASPTPEQQRAAADKSRILAINNMTFANVGTPAGASFYTIDGNGYTMTKSSTSNPMFRLNYNNTSSNTYVKFRNVILNADRVVTVNEETGVITCDSPVNGNWGALIHMRGSKATVDVANTTFMNSFSAGTVSATQSSPDNPPARTSTTSQGAAVFLHGGASAYLDSITVKNCYNTSTGVISADQGTSKIFLSGKCSFADNYVVNAVNPVIGDPVRGKGNDGKLETADDTYTFNYTYDYVNPVRSDLYIANADQLYIDGSFEGTVTPFTALSGNNTVFANLKEGDTLNPGASFVNTAHAELAAQAGSQAVNGYYPVLWKNPNAEDVTFTVKDITGSKVATSYVIGVIVGDPLPDIGCAWINNSTGTAETVHTAGASYTSDWTGVSDVEAVALKIDGQTLERGAFRTLAASADYMDIQLLKDITVDAKITVPIGAAYTANGNGFTVSRADGYYTSIIYLNSSLDVKFKNFVFDGRRVYTETGNAGNDNEGSSCFYNTQTNSTLTLESCEFKNCYNQSRGSVAKLASNAALYLKDVNIHDCWSAANGVIRAGYGGNATDGYIYSKVYLAGNTRITNDNAPTDEGKTGTNYIVANGCSIGVYETFTGKVEVNVTSSTREADNTPISPAGKDADAFVAEGAEIIGEILKVKDTDSEKQLTAYDRSGILCWTNTPRAGCIFDAGDGQTTMIDGGYTIGAALPSPYKTVGNTVQTAGWYYHDATTNTDVRTSVVINRNATYFAGAYSDADTTQATNETQGTVGTLDGLIQTAQEGDRIELQKDIDSIAEITIKAAITLDGNAHKITMTTANGGHLFNVDKVASGLTFVNIELNGGGVTKGVWDDPIASVNKRLVNLNGSNTVVTFEDCKLKGQRMYSTDEVISSAVNPSSARVYFKGTTEITDNLSMGVNSGTDFTYNSGKATSAIRNNGNGLVAFQGLVIIKENYSVKKENGETIIVSGKNLVPGGGTNDDGYKRVLINGNLEDGSEIWLQIDKGYMVGIDPVTNQPYTGIGSAIKSSGGSDRVNYIVSTPGAVEGDTSVHTANDGTIAAKYLQAATASVSTISAAGNITSDKFVLNISVDAIKADPETAFCGIKVGNQPETVISLATLPVQTQGATNSVYGTTVIGSVSVPIPCLTDDIIIRIFEEGSETALKTITTSVKAYAAKLIGMSDAELVTEHGVTEGKEIEMRIALKALLNFGGYSQVFFNHNPDKLANAGIYTNSPLNANDHDMVAGADVIFDYNNVKAKRTAGTVGVSVSNVSLIMDSQISLRMYLTFESGKTASDFSFSVEGAPYEVITVGDESYIEVKHIKTAELGDYVNLSITETGGDTVIFKCSPMTYVDIILRSEDVDVNLKNACKALYYYYRFAGEYFGFADTTGAGTVSGLSMITGVDPVNQYGALNVA